MNKVVKLFAFVVASVAMVGCVTPKANMSNSIESTKPVVVPAGKALVYFVRPNYLGFLISASVYDGDKFVGIVPYDHKLPYVAEPGEHMFMVISEAADFMKAELVAGRTYYAEVMPRMGAWKARFSLDPMTKSKLDNTEIRQKIDAAKVIENKPEAYKWAEDNKASVQEKKNGYFAKWSAKDEFQRPFLHADDGQ